MESDMALMRHAVPIAPGMGHSPERRRPGREYPRRGSHVPWQGGLRPPGGGAATTMNSKRCIDPVADMQRQNAKLAEAGCTISAPVKSGNAYSFTATCKMMGTRSNMKSTLVVESDSAYTLTVEGTAAGEPVKELMKARRTGDCTP